ncbi:hypothetical protein N7495_000175 [Penicillium taxi]|uniref:uncharacterized protein n=1 Tax=Penicillium taxi TaxID=168475 RepID=UPI00254538AF|nr:uncharacterized protein N7495_000175 [Penicillium taxi]KAJ5907493.1 hypothetical protein N7495_000175 [Penicillium taxi]
MSAPYQGEGRQSPDPETQTGQQLHDPPGSGKMSESTRHTHEFSQESSNNHFKEHGLESNPENEYSKIQAAKYGEKDKHD